MKKPKIRKQFNYELKQTDLEPVYGTSVTVPDMSMSISEILQNHTRGGQIPALEPVYYGDEDYYPNPATLDLTEKQDLLLSIAYQKEEHEKLQKTKAAESAKLAFEQSLEAEIKKRELAAASNPTG